MGSKKTVTVLLYKHRHGEDITVYDTPELALDGAVSIVKDYLLYLPDTLVRKEIEALLATGKNQEALDAWQLAQHSIGDHERIEISEDVNVQADPAYDDKAEIDPEKAGDTLVRIWKMCEESNDSNTTLAEISRILAALDSAPTGLRGALGATQGRGEGSGDVFDDVIAAIQNAEEAGGPEGKEYIDLMERIAAEATKRANVYRTTLAPKVPCCPKCTSTALDDFEVRETYSAYHPVKFRDDRGRIAVENALSTTCPSEHFDDGKGDFVATCRSCMHEDTPESFGIGSPDEWEWI